MPQRRDACDRIARLIRAGYPVLNLASALPRIADLTAPTPCHQCVIVEDGQQWTCGRCIEVPGLCQQCGFLFAGELSQLFAGDPRVIARRGADLRAGCCSERSAQATGVRPPDARTAGWRPATPAPPCRRAGVAHDAEPPSRACSSSIWPQSGSIKR